MHVCDVLACVSVKSRLRVLRVSIGRFLTRSTGALEEMENLRDCVVEKGVHSLGLSRLGRRELVYFRLM
jgi:hypothetical protein